MREVQFRKIDALFIKMSINDKLWIAFALFFAALTYSSVARYQDTISQMEAKAISNVESSLTAYIKSAESTAI
ncbi:methyl-accepting chemotaxis protein [Vibrio variabilis]|uniref:Methyl-accepting chemotaxis protein n=1 Tax=Vibrio variabilis TaxID=990271 RepID=A0ABQ0JJZ9_9VIBR|nr:methyl-accepting chemotaxis protein [Vibrio variabilis]